MASSITAFQSDIIDFILANRSSLGIFRREWYLKQKGFYAYFVDFKNILRDIRSKPDPEMQEDTNNATLDGSRSMSQFYESEELTKRMKWKRVTWDENADYNGFSRRLLENDELIRNVPAFSFLSLHIERDPLCSNVFSLPPRQSIIEQGALTNWILQERSPAAVEKYVLNESLPVRSPFTVDWETGEAKLVDTASIQEVLVFLQTVAPRLQALQIRMEEQQAKISNEIQNLKLRIGINIKFNQHDTTLWDDPHLKADPNYVTPDDVEQFIKGLKKSAVFYRLFLRGQCIRVIPPGRPYYLEAKSSELHIPANFASYNWHSIHGYFEMLERFIASMITLWWVWFSLAIIVVGDLELL
ncbi:hypothetical protein ERJ75_001733800 [Trypanosoma vivax]|uniref:Uncharacterized protein n=1 Tax=Trypanosoma vivax (strain Y486) TaxID=1055687 RepID=G0U340_TRYVY|nr:hypothetical protein TRVL_05210 [Trypanosoma vivax]KAH8604162.1 hypothetical protein ERJ75_001733800 [Trypanosoma vivax]CCC50695.1 conserved hypothetical protein [Trypanosoma vivax Y486]